MQAATGVLDVEVAGVDAGVVGLGEALDRGGGTGTFAILSASGAAR